MKCCNQCQVHQKLPASAPLYPWKWPGRPWIRLHADYAGLFLGEMRLIIDTHLEWMEVKIVPSTTLENTIKVLRSIFACHRVHNIETLFHYRSTSHTTTGLTLAEMLMGCQIWTHLDLMKPRLAPESES